MQTRPFNWFHPASCQQTRHFLNLTIRGRQSTRHNKCSVRCVVLASAQPFVMECLELQALPQPLTAEEAPPQTPSQPLALTELQ